MAIDDSILGMQLESPFGIDSAAVAVVPGAYSAFPSAPPSRHLLSPPWSADSSQFLCLYGDMGKMDAANCLKRCRLLPDTFALRHAFHDCTVVKQANT